MKIIGKRSVTPFKQGFTQELNDFLELCVRFRASNRYAAHGVYRFRSFKEANEWNMKMLLGKSPQQDRRQ
jgi:hypothetical protein